MTRRVAAALVFCTAMGCALFPRSAVDQRALELIDQQEVLLRALPKETPFETLTKERDELADRRAYLDRTMRMDVVAARNELEEVGCTLIEVDDGHLEARCVHAADAAETKVSNFMFVAMLALDRGDVRNTRFAYDPSSRLISVDVERVPLPVPPPAVRHASFPEVPDDVAITELRDRGVSDDLCRRAAANQKELREKHVLVELLRANRQTKLRLLEDGVALDYAWSPQVKPFDVVSFVALWGNHMLTSGFDLRQRADGSVEGWLFLRDGWRMEKVLVGIRELKDAVVTLRGSGPHHILVTVKPCGDDDVRAPCWVDSDDEP